MADVRAQSVSALEVLAFVCEIAMLVLLAVAGWRLGGLGPSILLPAVAAGLWGRWMAPTSRHRLADPARFVAQVVLFAATAAVCAAGGLWLLGVVFAVIAAAAFALARRTGGVTGG